MIKEVGFDSCNVVFSGLASALSVLNEDDYQYLSYDDDEKALLTSKVRLQDIFDPKSNKICTFNIVMNGVHQYKSFGGSI